MQAAPALQPLPPVGASPLDHHRSRLDDRGRGHARLEPETLCRLARDHCDEPSSPRHVELDLGEEALDLHLPDDALQAVAGAERLAIVAAQALDLPGRNDAPVGRVTLDADPSLPVPATKRVEADPECARRLAGRVGACHGAARYCICITYASRD